MACYLLLILLAPLQASDWSLPSQNGSPGPRQYNCSQGLSYAYIIIIAVLFRHVGLSELNMSSCITNKQKATLTAFIVTAPAIVFILAKEITDIL